MSADIKFVRIQRSEPLDTRPEVGLLAAVARQDPSVTAVSMNEVKTVEIAPNQIHTLFTHGLGGCTSALIISQKPDQSSIATMTHYDPTRQTRHLLVIALELAQHHQNMPEGTLHSVIILSPGDFYKAEGKWYKKIEDLSIVNPLVEAATSGLGYVEVAVKLCPYDETCIGECAAFIVRFSPQAPTPVSYEAHNEYYGSLPLKP